MGGILELNSRGLMMRKEGGRKLAVFEKMEGRGNLALKKGDSVIKYNLSL